MDIVKQATDNM